MLTANPEIVTARIQLRADIPSKKNQKMPARRSWRDPRPTIRTRPEVQAQINSLVLMTQSQWHRRPPLTNATIHYQFTFRERNKDLDNCLTTCSDVLVLAGVVVNDNTMHVHRISSDFTLGEYEQADITITGEVFSPEVQQLQRKATRKRSLGI